MTPPPKSSSSPSVHRVVIIDDHPLMREGLSRVIGMEPRFEIVAEIGEGKGALEQIRAGRPDVILLDLSLGDISGLDLIKHVRAGGIDAPVLVVSMHDEELYAERVIKAGGNGYIMKDEATGRVIEGMRKVIAGEIFVSDAMNRRLLNRMAGNSNEGSEGSIIGPLTDREVEIFELIGRGKPPRVIAANLGISPRTVDAHRTNIKAKLGLDSGAELVRLAVRWQENLADERNRGQP